MKPKAKCPTVLQENLTGVRVVRAFARQHFEIEKFEAQNSAYRNLTYRVIWLMAWYWAMSDFLSMLQIGAVLILGSYWAAAGSITLGTFVAFSSYVGMLLWPIRQLGRILTDMGKTFVSLDRIQTILDEPLEDYKSDAPRPPIHGELEFKNVTFGYDDESPVLRNVSFTAKQGQTIAILGPTGSGKSSLVHLLPSLYDYQSGSIIIDGCELRDIEKKWAARACGNSAAGTLPVLEDDSGKHRAGSSGRR